MNILAQLGLKCAGGSRRQGISAVEVCTILGIVTLLVALAWPWILSAREAARQTSCRYNLQRLGLALNSYHDTHNHYPVAAVWSTSAMDSLSLNRSHRFDLFTQANWAQAVLPFLDRMELSKQFDPKLPVAAPENAAARNTHLPEMSCPSDPFNVVENPFRVDPARGTSLTFARGNYGINGGSHCFKDGPGSTSFLTGDGTTLIMDRSTRQFQFFGNGVAGFNVSFSRDDFVNGASSLVLAEELRAGVDPIDPRGVWSLGQIGGSVTWAHGVNGDAYGPNNQEPRSDDLLHGDLLHRTVGADFLQQHRMPCVHYVDVNYQATARSAHPGGLNLVMVDGSTRFIADAIDPGLWHVLHSRETPPDVLAGDLETTIVASYDIPEKRADTRDPVTSEENPAPPFTNSIGMHFNWIPAGEFTMGLPDRGNDHTIPAESPPHRVRITRPFYLGTYEVTQAQYRSISETNPAFHVDHESPAASDNFPVEQVTWHEAQEFCRQLSETPEEIAAGRVYRLPTEAEWEYACRAGDPDPYRWSAQRRPDDHSGDTAGIESALPVQAVGQYPANAFGLCDLRGNVWEWCSDWFDRDYYSRSPIDDPQGPQHGYIKVVRGSSWTYVGEGCKLSHPMMPPWKSSRFIGFRVVCEPIPHHSAAVDNVGS